MLQWQMANGNVWQDGCGQCGKAEPGKKCVVLALLGNMILCEMDVGQTREVD